MTCLAVRDLQDQHAVVVIPDVCKWNKNSISDWWLC